MVRLLGVVLPDEKKIKFALTLLYGVGWSNAGKILAACNISEQKLVKELSEEEVKKIFALIEKDYMVEGDLREEITQNIKRLKEIGSYRGSRHSKNLPVRGQRTRSNARTKRGKRKTVGALKKEVWSKMDTQRPAEGAAAAPTPTKS